MAWRFYAQRATTGEWLNTNAQLADVELEWVLSAPGFASAAIPNGMDVNPIASDGRPTWGRFDTLLYAEEDGLLEWVGACTSANPDKGGLRLEFVGPTGLLQKIPYTDLYRQWEIDVIKVVRHLVKHANDKPDTLNIEVAGNELGLTVGDPEPPKKPEKPTRKKGETKKEFQDSKRYKAWEKKQKEWDDKYGDHQRYELLKWESPFIGEEIDNLAGEVGFDYREQFRWVDRGALKSELKMRVDETMGQRREDIQFIDGVNLAKALNPKDGGDEFANRVIGLGAGEGQKMRRVSVGGSDGRLYQAEYVQYKNLKNEDRLRKRAKVILDNLKTTTPEIDTVDIWDTPGMADIRTINVGDEIQVRSDNFAPPVAAWTRVVRIIRRPNSNIATVELVRAG